MKTLIHLPASIFFGLIYAVLYYLNDFLFSIAAINSTVSWVYLPAGFRLLAAILGGLSGSVGVGVASALIFYLSHSTSSALNVDMHTAFLVGIASGGVPYFVSRFFIHLKIIHNSLQGLNIKHIIFLSVCCAFGSVAAHQGIFWLVFPGHLYSDFVAMLVGDLIGIAIVLILFRLSLNFTTMLFNR